MRNATACQFFDPFSEASIPLVRQHLLQHDGIPNSQGQGQVQPCPMLRLPDELLAEIVSAAAAWPNDVGGNNFHGLYADCWAMTLVCRRFHRLATPLLYSRLVLTPLRTVNPKVLPSDISTPDSGPDTDHGPSFLRCFSTLCTSRILGLHRTVTANPSLRGFCTHMVLDMEHRQWAGHYEFSYYTKALVEWFSNTKSLRLHEALGDEQVTSTLALLQSASTSMRSLERLEFTALRTKPSVDRLLDFALRELIARFHKLKVLHLAGLAKDASGLPIRRPEREYPECKGLFTELSICDFFGPPEAFAALMRWPARLEQFTCLGRDRFGYSPLNLRIVWSALVPHMPSLRTIRIGSIANPMPRSSMSGMLAGVDFTLFESLTFLSLSYWATSSDSGEASLLARRLEMFEWSFNAEDNRPLYLDHFQKAEEDFLWRLARAAAEREVPLRRIDIAFTPTPVVGLMGTAGVEFLGVTETALEYPWDRMDRLAGQLRTWGFQLTYNAPSVTREHYEMAVLKARRQLGLY